MCPLECIVPTGVGIYSICKDNAHKLTYFELPCLYSESDMFLINGLKCTLLCVTWFLFMFSL